jgi:UDP-N-acetylmuramoyl-tripeptide--D-alanyl-D-alanine ligase
MLRACLTPYGATHAPEKSYNNHWGVPLTLARMPAETEFGVFEIGMNHAGEIAPLSKLVAPHIAIVTNVLPVHIGNFPDGEIGVANAKAEIFSGCSAGGTAVLPRDNVHYDRLEAAARAKGLEIVSFGIDARATVRADTLDTVEDHIDVTFGSDVR